MKPCIVPVKCPGCNNVLKREVAPIPPSQFSDPEAANIKSFFWCPHCETMLGVRFMFHEGQPPVTLGPYLDVSKWVTEQPVTKAITVRPKQKNNRGTK